MKKFIFILAMFISVNCMAQDIPIQIVIPHMYRQEVVNALEKGPRNLTIRNLPKMGSEGYVLFLKKLLRCFVKAYVKEANDNETIANAQKKISTNIVPEGVVDIN